MAWLTKPEDAALPRAPHGLVLACKHDGWRPPENTTMGVVAAHFETEHDGTRHVELDMIVVCPKCDAQMPLVATIGRVDHYYCEPCHRGRTIRRLK